MEPRPANAKELHRWQQFKYMALGCVDRWRSNDNKMAQAIITQTYATHYMKVTPPGIEYSKEVQKRQKRQLKVFERIINDVDLGKIAIHFPNGPKGDIDVTALNLMNDDELQEYQFGAVLIFIGLAMIISGIIMKATGLWDEDEEVSKNLDICKDWVDNKASNDPKFAADWARYKESRGWNISESWSEKFWRQADEFWEKAKEPLSHGISYAIPILVGIIGLAFVLKGKK